jgi:hypothetical protein
MNNEFDNDPVNRIWIGQARNVLDQSAQGLDAATLSRLNRARHAALAVNRPRTSRPWFLPAGLASACVILLAAVAWRAYAPAGLPALPLSPATSNNGGDVDLVSSDDSLEMYQDLEFYAWLDAQEQGSDG